MEKNDIVYSEMSNAELDALVAERVMGWQLKKPIDHDQYGDPAWCDSDGKAVWRVGCWWPTTDAEHSARLFRHLRESGLFSHIVSEWRGNDFVVRLFGPGLLEHAPMGVYITNAADDPNGFRCLCIAALKAYDALKKENN